MDLAKLELCVAKGATDGFSKVRIMRNLWDNKWL